jgi:hypothetical protein
VTAAKQTVHHVAALLLPILTVILGIIGFSQCRTNKERINFIELIILWKNCGFPSWYVETFSGILIGVYFTNKQLQMVHASRYYATLT